MSQLLATPERFDDKRVRVQGSLRVGNEERGLYLSPTDADYFNVAAGIWLDTREELSPRSGVVVVEGRFDADEHGHEGLWAATIREVKAVERVRSRSEYPQEMAERKKTPDKR
jgi:hypothetical protein